MKRKRLRQVINKQFHQLHIDLNNMMNGFDGEAIHAFRVQYKKSRACLRMLSQGTGDQGRLKLSRRIKKVYALAGQLRDLQLLRQEIKTVTRNQPAMPLAFLVNLQNKIAGLKPELSQYCCGISVTKNQKKLVKRLPVRFSRKQVNRYIRQKWDEVRQALVSAGNTDKSIHGIRKAVKDLLYITAIGKKIRKTVLTSSPWPVDQQNPFKKILDDLGEFQDRTVWIALLRSSLAAGLKATEKKQIDAIRKNLIRDKNYRKSRLLHQMKELLIR